jgi:hypothetical protein
MLTSCRATVMMHTRIHHRIWCPAGNPFPRNAPRRLPESSAERPGAGDDEEGGPLPDAAAEACGVVSCTHATANTVANADSRKPSYLRLVRQQGRQCRTGTDDQCLCGIITWCGPWDNWSKHATTSSGGGLSGCTSAHTGCTSCTHVQADCMHDHRRVM